MNNPVLSPFTQNVTGNNKRPRIPYKQPMLPGILIITSYPPRECGIATYSMDLIQALEQKFSGRFRILVCALESNTEIHQYTKQPAYILNTDQPEAFEMMASQINADPAIRMVLLQHEFGFYNGKEEAFIAMMRGISKPVLTSFHTVLPDPDRSLRILVQEIAAASQGIIIMTHTSEKILETIYNIPAEKLTVIPHGTHLVQHISKQTLKGKYGFTGRTILSTFGLLNSGKGIETTLEALPELIAENPELLFLIIGKTHPTIVKQEGEKYREMLELKVEALGLKEHVKFINAFLPLPQLLEHLQMTDIYLFTSRDPNQAVSGTFAYAISCGCPIISTPIPHAREVLKNDTGLIFDFGDAVQLADCIRTLLRDEELRSAISSNGLHRMASTAWENAAIAHALLFEKTGKGLFSLHYRLPEINMTHIRKMTTDFGMIQFAKLNHPDRSTGYTLDDNARALVACCQHFQLTHDPEDLIYIRIFFEFICFCIRPDGSFLNYVDSGKNFTEQNDAENLADSNGRAIWALGYLISLQDIIPADINRKAEQIFDAALGPVRNIHATRAMAFIIKGLYYRHQVLVKAENTQLLRELTNRLVQMYRHESGENWQWFEHYLTYANSLLPEALLCSWLVTKETVYRDIARSSFAFLLSKIMKQQRIEVISNKKWLQKGAPVPDIHPGGEQPIDVAYTVIALGKFYDTFHDKEYKQQMETAFSWFLGNNHLHQVIYNPCTGGCYDGLEDDYVNLNQGAESSVSYLIARLCMENISNEEVAPVTLSGKKRTLFLNG